MNITFCGAAETVTGSSFLIESGGKKILIDCGMFQGIETVNRNMEEFIFNPEEIDCVLLTHAHMDHSGMLPKLVRKGFNGKIYMTGPTSALVEILLMDSAKIQEQESSEFYLYNTSDAIKTLSMIESKEYEDEFQIQKDVKAMFFKAGHILGAASIYLEIDGKKMIFSGDLGRKNQTLVKQYSIPEKLKNREIDTIVMESLYGGEAHSSREKCIKDLIEYISIATQSDGNVIIPSFAVHRSQEILQILKNAFQYNHIKRNVQIYLDSPLASKATDIYTQHKEYLGDDFLYYKNVFSNSKSGTGITLSLNVNGDNNPFYFDNLQLVRSHKHSLRLMRKKRGVIIAGSGMADGGRVLHHLAAALPKNNNIIAFVGYQADGTLGREIVDGASTVFINNQKIKVRAKIKYLRGFSGHGDNSDLLDWFGNFKLSQDYKVFLVHAELDRSKAFKDQLLEIGVDAIIPKWKESSII
jgi:metallo-beta-lactamase family protein